MTTPATEIMRADHHQAKPPTVIERLADIPEEEIWLAKQKSTRPRRAYRLDVRHFMAILAITGHEDLRLVDHRAVIGWERHMREVERAAPSTIRRRLSALSSLFKHLVRHGHASKNPVTEVERPTINRDEGTTLAFSKQDARKLLDLPDPETLEGLDAESRSFCAACSNGQWKRVRFFS
jgi:integrase/recombinase XerD